MNLESVLGTINNEIIEIYDTTSNKIGAVVIWDIQYIVKSIILIVCIVYMFKGFISLIRMAGGFING